MSRSASCVAKIVHMRNGTTSPSSARSRTASCARAIRPSVSRSLSRSSSAGPEYGPAGTGLASAASAPDSTSSTRSPSTPRSSRDTDAGSATMPYAHQSRSAIPAAFFAAPEARELCLDAVETVGDAVVLLPTAECGIALPPVDADLLGLVDRGDHEPQLDRQQLDVEQVDLDVARDHDPLVEHPLEHVGEAVGARVAGEVRRRPLINGAHALTSRRRPTRGDTAGGA